MKQKCQLVTMSLCRLKRLRIRNLLAQQLTIRDDRNFGDGPLELGAAIARPLGLGIGLGIG